MSIATFESSLETVPVASGRSDSGRDWRRALPALQSGDVVLREVHLSDAHTLKAFLTTPETSRFISAPPSTVEGFERFIQASREARSSGRGACFAVTCGQSDLAIGLVQVRRIDPSTDDGPGMSVPTAEWGFAIGSPFWGCGAFPHAAALAIHFAFGDLQAQRLEARCAVDNARGRKALAKVGARAERILPQAFLCRGEYLDQVLYAIGKEEWRSRRHRGEAAAIVHVH